MFKHWIELVQVSWGPLNWWWWNDYYA